jgi:hypothetical protein
MVDAMELRRTWGTRFVLVMQKQVPFGNEKQKYSCYFLCLASDIL